MQARVITAPAPIVDWSDAKSHLRIDHDEEQVYVETLVAAATGWLDGPAGWLGRALGAQLLECTFEHGCSPVIRLPFPPHIEVIEAWCGDQQIDVSAYSPGSSSLFLGQTFPIGWPVRVQYWSGYGRRDGTDPSKWINTVPQPIKIAILLLVGQWYNTRENVVVGDRPTEIPFASDALLAPYRVFS